MMLYFDPFVLPFTIGIIGLIIFLIIKFSRWIILFSSDEKRTIKRNILTTKSIKAIFEVINESLIHNKIFKVNPFLGYMHMCFGLGWFLLIVVGKIESLVYHASFFNPPYFAIFFRYFHPAHETFPYCDEFAFAMDLILLFILSGLTLALLKRLYSRVVGMKKITKHRPFDILTLTVLWSIFPLRFLAESFTSGAQGGGGFLTHNSGLFFAQYLPIETLSYPLWWAYSISLGTFFALLPFSRYMHIPTEIVYIFLKNWGLKSGNKFSSYTKFQVYSCSRCGICIDRCQLNTSLGYNDNQAIYFLKKVRHNKRHHNIVRNCLMCGRCEESCPVDIELNGIRLSKREDNSISTIDTYSYLNNFELKSAKVAYFAGCMGHLTPTIIKSMEHILNKAEINYSFIDKDGSACCGRPLMLAGNMNIADSLIEKNIDIFKSSGAELIVTSCPICYKTFKEDYKNLNIKVLHHTEYINNLIKDGILKVNRSDISTIFHSPCELGRGSNIVKAPHEILERVSTRVKSKYDGRESLCCGGSLANTFISPEERTKIAKDTLNIYSSSGAKSVVTACPLCKKSFSKCETNVEIKDIAEVVAEYC